MKKNFVRIVAALLVAMLALTLIPLGAFAIEAGYLETNVYDKKNPTIADPHIVLNSSTPTEGTKIKVNDFDEIYIDANGDVYDFKGFATTEKFQKKANKILNDTSLTDPERQKALQKLAEDIDLNFTKKDLKIDAFPTTGSAEKQTEWFQKWGWVIAGYAPHQHKLSRWYSDGTTHWKECLICKNYKSEGIWEQFMYQNWCQDGDEDGICNICGGDVPYHDIKVIETEGATVTLNRDNASHRMKITADVEAKDGYKVDKIHFIKVRDDGSKQEITRHKKDGQFFTYMPTYEMEITVDVTKK